MPDIAAKPIKVLVVDDSSFSRRNMRLLLEELGHQVEEATDGNQALERIHISPPDLMMLDLVMPGLGGLEVLALAIKIRPELPVIVATSDVQCLTMDEARAGGARALINKPLKKGQLASVVSQALGGGNSWPSS
jgi:two-component system chemotaxis response regulator CheY